MWNRSRNKGKCILTNCVNTGNIGQFAGGLCGYEAGYIGECTLINCINSGHILANAFFSGGLCGYSAGYDEGECILINCTNTGNIGAIGAGGICGSFAGAGIKGKCILTNCTNSGNILAGAIGAGGLCGSGNNEILMRTVKILEY